MPHQIAKLLLEQAGNFLERSEAVRTALSLGMPLNEIEEYLDWLDAVRPGLRQRCQPPERIGPGEPASRRPVHSDRSIPAEPQPPSTTADRSAESPGSQQGRARGETDASSQAGQHKRPQ